jgi:peptidoglycan/LPS O-acetylase OafA/YrhL
VGVTGTAPVTTAGTRGETGQRQRVVWFAHFARALAALVVLWARYIAEFREQKQLVSAFVFTEPIALVDIPKSFLLDAYIWSRDALTIDLGAAAVGVFFVLSGFVIPFALERRTLPAYGIRRVLRVYPTLWAVTALSVLMILVVSKWELPFSWDRVWTQGTLINQYTGNDWVDPSYWTIPIEELFYVVAALLAVTRLLRRPWAVVLAAAGVSALALSLGRVTPDIAPGESPGWEFWTRFWLGRNLGFMTFIFVGVALHMLYRRFWSRTTFVVVTALVCGIYYLTLHNGPFRPPFLPGGDQATTYFRSFMLGLGAFLLFYWIGDRLPKNKPIKVLGDISYPIYLVGAVIGWGILVFFTRGLGNYFLAVPVTVIAVLLLAYGLHRVVEKPTMDFSQRFTAKPYFRKERSWSDEPKPWFRRRTPPPVEEDVVVPAPPPARTDEEPGVPVVEHHMDTEADRQFPLRP